MIRVARLIVSYRGVGIVALASLLMVGCGGEDTIVLEAPSESISVDGDAADWADVPAQDLELHPVLRQEIPEHMAKVSVAHDEDNVYVLLEVTDNLTWTEGDAHKSAAAAVMWRIDDPASPHMGAEEDALGTSLGMVDIWHWELDCPAGSPTGGAVSDAGDGDPGNDAACNLDDEWSTTPSEREDDNASGAENSLFGVWGHDGSSWIFEFSRPLATGDETDADLTAGGNLAVAYWDADNGEEGWDALEHLVSSDAGWIEVDFGS